MKTKAVVNVSVNGCQSRPSMKKCILVCLKSVVPCLFEEATCKNKVMKIAATLPGVETLSIEAEKNLLTVIGEGIDTVELVNELRKKVGFANIVNQGPEEEKKKEEKPAAQPETVPMVNCNCNCNCNCNNNNNRVLPEMFEIRDPYYYNYSCFPFW